MFRKVVSFFKKNILGIIIGGVIFGSLGVCAATYFPSNNVTYENKNSGLKSTDVQGAIDELYNECFPDIPPAPTIDEIISNTVSSGDGLYKDEYENGKYTYKGANPNNYVTFNNEEWRIIAINSDKTIKIMKTNSIGELTFDSSNSNIWARPATLNTDLNETYLGTLSAEAQSQIVLAAYNAGTIEFNNTNMQTQINNEKTSTWYGKIALPTTSEYIRAGSNTNCKTFYQFYYNDKTCKNSIWMNNNTDWWTITPYNRNSNSVLSINSGGGIGYYDYASYANNVRPVVTLSSEIKFVSGDGSQENPFNISL